MLYTEKSVLLGFRRSGHNYCDAVQIGEVCNELGLQ